ncbi:flagellin [Methylorubrum zatmanii]|uniref:Flagellin n=1 Tax=Methylorubrum zatmanii TaxID=29429 RepID=A0ABW1WIE8_9HYPH|nr:flagellin [Methylorubrum zatmanii]
MSRQVVATSRDDAFAADLTMTITAFAAGTYRFDRQSASLVGMKNQLDGLAQQLATGRTAETYGGLGAARTTSLSAHATISAQEGYLAAISSAETRVKLTSASLTQLKSLSDSTRSNLTGIIASRNETLPATTVQLASSNLSAAIDALNQQAGGVYVFSGRATDTAPVLSQQAILNGDPAAGLDGLKALIAEQKKADLGSGNGRLTQTASGTTIDLSEDASAEARANFGFSLLSAASSGSGALSATVTAGTKATVALSFTQQPADGAQVRVVVQLADGSQKTLDLTARAKEAASAAGTFAIGATKEETAANLKAALGGADIASVQSANPPGVAAAFSGGQEAKAKLSLTANPSVGDTVTLKLGMHDGTTRSITLTAAASADPTSATTFTIGATPEQTTANLSRSLSNALGQAANTDLSASSTARASLNFFEGSPAAGLSPRRVAADGNGYAETASNKTVIWYQGDTSADPRGTAAVQVGTSRTVEIGAQANEEAIRRSMAGIAAMAAESFTTTGETVDTERFRALSNRAGSLLTAGDGQQSLEELGTDFGLAASSMANAKSVANATKTTLESSLDGVDTVSTEEVAAKLLSLQTQLQASYKVTSILSEMSLVNYMR